MSAPARVMVSKKLLRDPQPVKSIEAWVGQVLGVSDL